MPHASIYPMLLFTFSISCFGEPLYDKAMSSSQYRPILVLTSLRWFARFWGLAFAVLILALAIGEGFNPAKLKTKELLLTVPFFVAWLGLLLGWRWEGWGGILVVAGIAGFCLIHFVVTGFGRFPGWAFPAIGVPGLLYLLSWFCRRKIPTPLALR